MRLTKTLFLSVMFYAGLVWMKDSNMKAIKQLWYKLVKSGVGAVFNIKLALGEVILGLPPLEVLQIKVYSDKHYLKIGIFPSDTDRLSLLISDTDTLMVPELRAAMKEVYLFLKWKLTRIPEAFTVNEKMIIEGKEYDQFSTLSVKACSYSKGLMRIYSEFMWQGYINNIYQIEGECRIPTVSCQSLHIPVYTVYSIKTTLWNHFCTQSKEQIVLSVYAVLKHKLQYMRSFTVAWYQTFKKWRSTSLLEV